MAQLKNGTTIGGYKALHKGNLTDLNQLNNGPGYVTVNDTIIPSKIQYATSTTRGAVRIEINPNGTLYI